MRLNALLYPDRLWLVWGSIVGALIGWHLLERLFPARPPTWNLHSLGASIFYLALAPLAAVVPAVLVYSFLQSIGAREWTVMLNMQVLGLWLDEPKSLPYQPSAFAIVVMTMLWLLIYDFFYYWFHRLQHTRLLWWQHKLHHADHHFSVATAWRVHWLDESLRVFLILLPMGLLLEVTLLQAMWMAYITAQFVFFAHANLRLSMGLLTPLFVGPQYHRIHHSIRPEHRDRNFAGTFPVWDILFGTYYRPKSWEFPQTGVDGEPTSVTARSLLIGR